MRAHLGHSLTLRVLHTPAAVGGHPSGLARAERELGLASRVVVLDPPPFGFGADEILFRPGNGRVARELRRWGLLLRALRDFDVLHFNFGTTITPAYVPVPAAGLGLGPRIAALYGRALELRELALLRRAGKAIFVTFQGGDARQRDFSLANFEITYATEAPPELDSDEYDARRRWKIERFGRFADGIYALNPDLLHVLPEGARFLPYASVDLREWRYVDAPRGEVPVVVHAPTDPAIKGTRFVVDAVRRLQDEGVKLEYVQIEGASQTDARAAFERADLFVDQLLAGWYGGVAVELMALGRPVVCYVREGDLQFVPTAMRSELPVINATPRTVYEVLREWLTRRRQELPEVGRRSRTFVERWHDPLSVAGRVRDDYAAAVRRPVSPTPHSGSPNSSR